MEDIYQTDVHYVRCIKPNATQSKTYFDRKMVVDQLRSSGVIEAMRITRAAYPFRITQTDFLRLFDRLKPIPARKFDRLPIRDQCRLYLEKLSNFRDASKTNVKLNKLFGPRRRIYEIGNTKVYIDSFTD
jgi:myosin-5